MNQVGRYADGRWCCVRDGVTEPCGDCDGCRLVEADKRAIRRRCAQCLTPSSCAAYGCGR